MTNTENPSRRQEDQHPTEPLQWDTVQPLIDAARAHLAQDHSAAGVIPVPHTNPQQFIAIGTAIEIGGLLPEGFGTSYTGLAAATVRALLIQLTTFDAKMVSGSALAQAAHEILALQRTAAEEAELQDPLDMPLPCDVTIGAGTIRKGVRLGILVSRAQGLHRMLMEHMPKPTPEQRGAFEALFQLGGKEGGDT